VIWDRDDSTQEGREPSLGGFFRSLFSGIPWSESAEREEVITRPRPQGGAVRISNSNGKTRVVGEEREDVEILAHKYARAESEDAAEQMLERIRVVAEEVGGSLDLEAVIPKKWNRHGSVSLEVRVPRAVRLEVSAANGKVCLEGLRSSVDARSSNGPVRIHDVLGDIDVFTSNAKVSCDCTCGRLIARSSNGKIELGAHRGSIDASTSNGFIRATIEELGREGVRLATSNGRIVLELPEDVDAEVDIRVENGVIRSSRSLEGAGDEANGRMRGRLGRGGAQIRLRTSNGVISLR